MDLTPQQLRLLIDVLNEAIDTEEEMAEDNRALIEALQAEGNIDAQPFPLELAQATLEQLIQEAAG